MHQVLFGPPLPGGAAFQDSSSIPQSLEPYTLYTGLQAVEHHNPRVLLDRPGDTDLRHHQWLRAVPVLQDQEPPPLARVQGTHSLVCLFGEAAAACHRRDWPRDARLLLQGQHDHEDTQVRGDEHGLERRAHHRKEERRDREPDVRQGFLRLPQPCHTQDPSLPAEQGPRDALCHRGRANHWGHWYPHRRQPPRCPQHPEQAGHPVRHQGARLLRCCAAAARRQWLHPFRPGKALRAFLGVPPAKLYSRPGQWLPLAGGRGPAGDRHQLRQQDQTGEVLATPRQQQDARAGCHQGDD
mmetsp:Transcript_15672/g.61219  ORF Transcript_15672/g.61219 Transcript_15672/m.61219 type:complete len:297 (-) Transcript_15672:856-1746(-)